MRLPQVATFHETAGRQCGLRKEATNENIVLADLITLDWSRQDALILSWRAAHILSPIPQRRRPWPPANQ